MAFGRRSTGDSRSDDTVNCSARAQLATHVQLVAQVVGLGTAIEPTVILYVIQSCCCDDGLLLMLCEPC